MKTFKIIFKGGCNLMKVIDTIALVLIIIGAINWGLVGIFNFNLQITEIKWLLNTTVIY